MQPVVTRTVLFLLLADHQSVPTSCCHRDRSGAESGWGHCPADQWGLCARTDARISKSIFPEMSAQSLYVSCWTRRWTLPSWCGGASPRGSWDTLRGATSGIPWSTPGATPLNGPTTTPSSWLELPSTTGSTITRCREMVFLPLIFFFVVEQ